MLPPTPRCSSTASNNYWRTEDQLVLTDIKNTHNQPIVKLPNKVTMNVTKSGNILFSISISLHAKRHTPLMDCIVPQLSICANCVMITASLYLIRIKFNIIKDSNIILKVHGKKSYELLDIPISIPLIHWSNYIIERDKTKIDLIQYPHGCCSIPTPRTFLKAIKNGKLLTWHGLNNEQF